MSGPLLRFSIQNFQGIVSFDAAPNGSSLELHGKSGAGKSSAITFLGAALGLKMDVEAIRNGEDQAGGFVEIGDYRVTAKWERGKPRKLSIKSIDGRIPYGSSPSILRGFTDALEVRTFSTRKPAEQAEIIKQLCPGIDTSKLDAEYADRYAERTQINRDADTFAKQAAGVVVPPAPESVEADIDLVQIVALKTDAEKQLREIDQLKNRKECAELELRRAETEIMNLRLALERAEGHRGNCVSTVAKATDELQMRPKAPDTSAIDAELATARETNRQRTLARQQQRDAERAKEQRAKLEKDAKTTAAKADRLTARLDAIKQEKAAQIAAAKLPIDGLALADGAVTFGGVELAAVNTAARMRLDVVIAAALGHRLIAVRDASLLDEDSRAELAKFAAGHGVQLISEIVTRGVALTAEIVEGEL